ASLSGPWGEGRGGRGPLGAAGPRGKWDAGVVPRRAVPGGGGGGPPGAERQAGRVQPPVGRLFRRCPTDPRIGRNRTILEPPGAAWSPVAESAGLPGTWFPGGGRRAVVYRACPAARCAGSGFDEAGQSGRGNMNSSRMLCFARAFGVTILLAATLAVLSAWPLALATVALDDGALAGVVSGPNGPEAGVWVIAETTDLPTRFVRIVVTDDEGRYMLPDLPPASYQVWVRGYGLVDSPKVQAAPGRMLDLTAVVAPDPRAAAQY